MEKTSSHFGLKLGIVAAVLVILSGVYILWETGVFADKGSLYTDPIAKFSIELPHGWSVREKAGGTLVSSTWFHNASSTEATGLQIAVERFPRTNEINTIIENFGTEHFTQGLIESLWVDLELNILKNERIVVGDREFIHTHSIYMGKNSGREVTQHMYFTFTDDFYYRIGVDAYTDVWEKNEGVIMKSLRTFEVL